MTTQLQLIIIIISIKIHVTPFGDNFYLNLPVNLNNEQQGLNGFILQKSCSFNAPCKV